MFSVIMYSIAIMKLPSIRPRVSDWPITACCMWK